MKPRTESLLATKGLALMRAIDWRMSRSRSEKASRGKCGRRPGLFSISAFTSSSVKVSMPQSVWWIRMISRVPSSHWEMARDRTTSAVTTPPALRVTRGSPSALALVQAQQGVHVGAGVHAGDHGRGLARGHREVALAEGARELVVVAEQVVGDRHGPSLTGWAGPGVGPVRPRATRTRERRPSATSAPGSRDSRR